MSAPEPGEHKNGQDSSGKTSPISTASSNTMVERNIACEQDDTADKHAIVIDIDPHTRVPRDGMRFRKPLVEDLLKKGPAGIMSDSHDHRPAIRWIHLRSNVMAWIEDLMSKICEERHISMPENPSDRPTTPTTLNPLLRKDLWSHLFHGKASDQIQTRFMGPVCTPFSIDIDDEHSDSSGGTTRGPRDNLVMYLPYMNWESAASWDQRQTLMNDIRANRRCTPQADTNLIRDYLHHKSAPLHDRRTLDQAYFHDFGMTRSLPQYDQVMHRFTRDMSSEQEAKLIVIDQLWLWVIRGAGSNEDDDGHFHPDLVITAFPGRFNGEYDSADIFHGIIGHLERGLDPPLRNANDLVSAIVEHCTGVFFQRQLESDKWFLEFFAAAIGAVRDKQKSAFSDFCHTSQELERLQARQASLVEVSRKLEDSTFSITVETELFRQAKDIIDELGCIDYILSRQCDMTNALTRSQKSRSLKTVSEMVKERREAWSAVNDTAKLAVEEIKTQMDLKQKQSSLIETRTSRYQVEDSARHGRIMLLFTVVTIIFLPMSFLATWFGMNLKGGADDNGQLSLGIIAAVVFPLSLLIAFIALAFAFSERLRDRAAAVFERIIDSTIGALGIHGSRSGIRPRRDLERPPRWDVRLRRLTELSAQDEEEGCVQTV